MTKILYVTSFNHKIYHATGKTLIKSFLSTNQLGHLLICYENLENSDICSITGSSNFLTCDLNKYDYLNNWLEKNKDIIPRELGGTATKKTHPQIYEQPFTYMNYRASKFFRKVASLKYALDHYQDIYDWIIWVDSDCCFKKQIPFKLYDDLSTKGGYFYFLGNGRKSKHIYGVETGFVGFHQGHPVLQEWIDAFEEKFRKYQKWDDGFVFRMILQERNYREGVDIGSQNNKDSPMSGQQTFYKYIEHKKGFHRKQGVMY